MKSPMDVFDGELPSNNMDQLEDVDAQLMLPLREVWNKICGKNGVTFRDYRFRFKKIVYENFNSLTIKVLIFFSNFIVFMYRLIKKDKAWVFLIFMRNLCKM